MKKLVATIATVLCLAANVTTPLPQADEVDPPTICNSSIAVTHYDGPGAMDFIVMQMSATVNDVQGAGWQLLCYNVTTPTYDPWLVGGGLVPHDGTFTLSGSLIMTHSNDLLWFVFRVEDFEGREAYREMEYRCRN